MNKKQLHANLAILLSTFFFGLNIPVAKSVLSSGHLHPLGLSMLRLLIPLVLFWFVSLFSYRERVGKNDMIRLFFCSLLGVALNQFPFVIGLANTSPVDASIIITLSPVFVMLLSAMILKEPVTLKKAGGVLLGGCGALLIVISSQHSHNGISSWWGNLLVFSTTIVYALYLVLVKPLSAKYSTITIMKWLFLYSSVLAIPFFYDKMNISPEIDMNTVLGILYITICATFWAYLLVPAGLKNLRPTTVGMYNYAQPLIASFVAIIAGQDVLTWQKPVSLLLVFVGVYLVMRSKSRAQVEAQKAAEIAEEGHA